MIIESEKSLSCRPLTNPYIPNSINWTQESCYFGNQGSISAHPFELDQTTSFESHIDILTSYPFPEIEIKPDCDPELYVSNSISLFNSIMTPVSLPDFFSIPESLNPGFQNNMILGFN